MNNAELFRNDGSRLGIITIDEYKQKFEQNPSYFLDKKLRCCGKCSPKGGIPRSCGIELIACALNSEEVEPYFRAKNEEERHNPECEYYLEEQKDKIPVEFKANFVIPNGDDDFDGLMRIVFHGDKAPTQCKNNDSLQNVANREPVARANYTGERDEEIRDKPPRTLSEYYRSAFLSVGVEESFKNKIIYPENSSNFKNGLHELQGRGMALVRTKFLEEEEKKEIINKCGITVPAKQVVFLQDSFLPTENTIIFALTVKSNVLSELWKKIRPEKIEGKTVQNHFVVFSHDWATHRITTKTGKSLIVVVGSIVSEKQLARLSQKFVEYQLSSYIYNLKK